MKINKYKPIDDFGVIASSTNGGFKQEVIFKIKNDIFKISIRSESIVEQCFCDLYKWSDSTGFMLIIRKNPVKHFNINVAYKCTAKDPFRMILDNLIELANEFVTKG